MHDQHVHSFPPNLDPIKHIVARCTTYILYADNIHVIYQECSANVCIEKWAIPPTLHRGMAT